MLYEVITDDIVSMLELFLLNNGIRPSFYQSEFGQYWQDAMFGNEELDSFKPDVIFIHTSGRNIINYPNVKMTAQEVNDMLSEQYEYFATMWENLRNNFV